MITKIKENSKNIYLFGIFLVCVKIFTERSDLFKINDAILIIIFSLCFGIKMMTQTFNKREILITIITGVISSLVAIITREFVPLYLFLILFSSKDINIEDIIKISFYTISSLFIVSAIIYAVNAIIGDIPINYRPDGTARYTLYLNHPNIVAGLALWLTAQYLYINYEKIGKLDYIVCIIFFVIVYLITKSRTTLISSFLLLFLIIINKKIKKKTIMNVIAKYSFIVLGILMIGLGFLYTFYSDNSIIKKTNQVLSYRMYLQSTSVERYGISLFPRNINLTEKIKWVTGAEREIFLDSIYSRTLIKYGIIYLILLFYISKNLINKNSNKESVFVLLFAVVAAMERYILLPTIGFPLLFFKDYLWNEKNRDELNAINEQENNTENID